MNPTLLTAVALETVELPEYEFRLGNLTLCLALDLTHKTPVWSKIKSKTKS